MPRRSQDESIMHAESAAKPQASPSFDAAKVKEHAGMQFVIEGNDARFENGRFASKRVSELVKTPEGRDWLGGLWRIAHRDLQAVIKVQFDGLS